MAHWCDVLKIPMLEVRYEQLVADQEGHTRRIIDFCGLDWDDRCLRFYEGDRVVLTSSYDQVNRPIYTSSLGRHRNFDSHLGPEPSGTGLRSGSGVRGVGAGIGFQTGWQPTGTWKRISAATWPARLPPPG